MLEIGRPLARAAVDQQQSFGPSQSDNVAAGASYYNQSITQGGEGQRLL
jgi:hypothetical protein